MGSVCSEVDVPVCNMYTYDMGCEATLLWSPAAGIVLEGGSAVGVTVKATICVDTIILLALIGAGGFGVHLLSGLRGLDLH